MYLINTENEETDVYGVVAEVASFAALRKRRVIEQHNRRTKRKLKSHPPPQKTCEAPSVAPGAISVFALCAGCVAQ